MKPAPTPHLSEQQRATIAGALRDKDWAFLSHLADFLRQDPAQAAVAALMDALPDDASPDQLKQALQDFSLLHGALAEMAAMMVRHCLDTQGVAS